MLLVRVRYARYCSECVCCGNIMRTHMRGSHAGRKETEKPHNQQCTTQTQTSPNQTQRSLYKRTSDPKRMPRKHEHILISIGRRVSGVKRSIVLSTKNLNTNTQCVCAERATHCTASNKNKSVHIYFLLLEYTRSYTHTHTSRWWKLGDALCSICCFPNQIRQSGNTHTRDFILTVVPTAAPRTSCAHML